MDWVSEGVLKSKFEVEVEQWWLLVGRKEKVFLLLLVPGPLGYSIIEKCSIRYYTFQKAFLTLHRLFLFDTFDEI